MIKVTSPLNLAPGEEITSITTYVIRDRIVFLFHSSMGSRVNMVMDTEGYLSLVSAMLEVSGKVKNGR